MTPNSNLAPYLLTSSPYQLKTQLKTMVMSVLCSQTVSHMAKISVDAVISFFLKSGHKWQLQDDVKMLKHIVPVAQLAK